MLRRHSRRSSLARHRLTSCILRSIDLYLDLNLNVSIFSFVVFQDCSRMPICRDRSILRLRHSSMRSHSRKNKNKQHIFGPSVILFMFRFDMWDAEREQGVSFWVRFFGFFYLFIRLFKIRKLIGQFNSTTSTFMGNDWQIKHFLFKNRFCDSK